jgi:ectoine hydroxylase-related dioxygenase (phytanoyl-CoA dioxygenase family)
MSLDIDGTVHELTQGQGYVILEGHFDAATVARARARLMELAGPMPQAPEPVARETLDTITTRAPGTDTLVNNVEVWNLIDKGEIFRTMAAEPRMLEIMAPILGDDLMLGSWAGRVLFPGAPAQEPHVDYPYWDLFDRGNWPRTIDASFHLAVEAVVMLDDFTTENGATGLLPGSQKLCRWPDPAEFERRGIQATGRAGSLILFPALMWHGGHGNRSDFSRAAVLGCYVSKSIRPIEDWRRCVSAATLKACDRRLIDLLGVEYPYPADMDRLPPPPAESGDST